jgi:hypothetical protein
VNNIVDILGNFIQAWLEDLEPQELYEEMESTVNQYTMEKQKESVKEYYDYVVNKCISEFEESLSQYTELEITNETKTEENNG